MVILCGSIPTQTLLVREHCCIHWATTSECSLPITRCYFQGKCARLIEFAKLDS